LKLALYEPISAGSNPAHRNINQNIIADGWDAWATEVGAFMDARRVDDVVVDKPGGHDGTGNFAQLDWAPPHLESWRRAVATLNQGHRKLYVYLPMPPAAFFGCDVFEKAERFGKWLRPYGGCICIMDSAVVKWNQARKTADETFRLADAMLDGDLGIEHWGFAGSGLGARTGLGTIRMLGPSWFRDSAGNPPAYGDNIAMFDIRPRVRNFHLHNDMWNPETNTYDRWKLDEIPRVWHWASQRGLTNLVHREAMEHWNVTAADWATKLAGLAETPQTT
jgi:hypothetical protein